MTLIVYTVIEIIVMVVPVHIILLHKVKALVDDTLLNIANIEDLLLVISSLTPPTTLTNCEIQLRGIRYYVIKIGFKIIESFSDLRTLRFLLGIVQILHIHRTEGKLSLIHI